MIAYFITRILFSLEDFLLSSTYSILDKWKSVTHFARGGGQDGSTSGQGSRSWSMNEFSEESITCLLTSCSHCTSSTSSWCVTVGFSG